MKEKLLEVFAHKFGKTDGIRYFFAPGRVNLMGDHVDYCMGMTLPCALELGTYAAVRKNGLRMVRMFSIGYENAGVITSLLSPISNQKDQQWANYPLGVVKTFLDANYELSEGFDVVYAADLPANSGLSSSASIEVLTAYFLCRMYDFNLTLADMACLCKKVENEFIGMQCGILDQLSSAMGKAGHAIYMNTNTLECKYAPFDLGDYELLIINSNKKHDLVETKYNERRAECEQALKILSAQSPKEALCGYTKEEFEKLSGCFTDEVLKRRARHVILENERTKATFEAFLSGDLKKVGQLFYESHESLSKDYEVSCKETDFIVNFAKKYDEVLGARMTGGGFGGCVIAIVKKEFSQLFSAELDISYFAAMGYRPTILTAKAGQGPTELQ